MQCISCGFRLAYGSHVCARCGARLDPKATPTVDNPTLGPATIVLIICVFLLSWVWLLSPRGAPKLASRSPSTSNVISPLMSSIGSPNDILQTQLSLHQETFEKLRKARDERDFDESVELLEDRAAELRHAIAKVKVSDWSRTDKARVIATLDQELAWAEIGAVKIRSP